MHSAVRVAHQVPGLGGTDESSSGEKSVSEDEVMMVDDAPTAEDKASGSGPPDGTKVRGESDNHRPLFPVASSSGKQAAGLGEISGRRESSALIDALWPKTGGKQPTRTS